MKHQLLFLLVLTLSCNKFARHALAQTVEQKPIRINCGVNDKDYVDPDNNTWIPDTGFYIGNTRKSFTTSSISNTDKEHLYRSERYKANAAAPMKYNIPVANGLYDVHLHLAETYSNAFSVGSRVFDVFMEGGLVSIQELGCIQGGWKRGKQSRRHDQDRC